MHGAALTYAALMPPHGGVLEAWPKDRDMWRCFEHLATMAGLHYARWENRDPARFRADAGGDYTTLPPEELVPLYRSVLAAVRARIDATLAGGGLLA